MSRIGRLPVEIPAGVTVTVDANNLVKVKGPLGELSQQVIADGTIKVEVKENLVHVTRSNDTKDVKALHGLYRKLIFNMVEGVTKGFTKSLIVNGVGYKASMKGANVILNIGYSHPVEIVAPAGIKLSVNGTNEVVVTGIDKEAVGQLAANIRDKKKPDPYFAYGIRYSDEEVARKEGKTAGK